MAFLVDKNLLAETTTDGKVAVLPTDTVYGLVCSALQPEVVKRMYEIKRRAGKPGTIIAANAEQLISMGFDKEEVARAEKFWPDAVSVILEAGPELAYLHMGLESLAVRIPKPEWLREILEQTGPLATTSCNLPGEPTVTTIDQAKALFSSQVDLYVDGGDLSGNAPSKIIQLLERDNFKQIR